jgi:TatA/E family protein of Tat protein translocase
MLAFISDTGIVIAVIAFVALFGASQIPKLARNLGEAGREFRKAHGEMQSAAATEPSAPTATPLANPSAPITLTRAQLDELLTSHRAPAENPS